MENNTIVKPIFIISTARSGTNSISNHLCQHSKIFGFLSNKHWGIHEGGFLTSWQYYFGDLKKDENLFFFIESFSQSDTFKLSGINKDILYKNKPENMIDVMRIIIDQIQKKDVYRYFLFNNPHQSFYIKELIDNFPDAYFISIKRPIVPTIKSRVKKYEKKSIFSIAKHVFGYQLDFGAFEKEKKKIKNIMEVHFDDLVNNKEYTLKKIIDFLKIPWEEDVCNNPYKIQSSFEKKETQKTFFTKGDIIVINFFDNIFKLFPYRNLKKPFGIWWDKRKAKSSIVPPFYYRLHPYSDYFKGYRFDKDGLKKNKFK